MKRVWRLLHYMRPYTVHVIVVLLMLIVGALAAFRILLIKPIMDNVLSPAIAPDRMLLFIIPKRHHLIDLQ